MTIASAASPQGADGNARRDGPPSVLPGTRQIPLSRGLFALVDEADYEQVSALRWYATHAGRARDKWYAVRSLAKGRRLLMHRLILSAPAGSEVDHINGDGLDNRRANLRLCARWQNCVNTRRLSATGYRAMDKFWQAFDGRKEP